MAEGLEFLKMYSGKSTARIYSLGIRRFLESVYGIEIMNGDLERHVARYLGEPGRDHKADAEKFFISVKDRPPMTIRSFLTGVRMFYAQNGIDLPPLFWRNLTRKIRGTRALTMDRVPSNAELKRIILNMPQQGKALYLVLASSGMRIGEALALREGDLKLDADPPKVLIRATSSKSGNGRITFISGEAKEAVADWLRHKPEYLKSMVQRTKPQYRDPKALDSPLIFPFVMNTAYEIWRNALKRLGMEERDADTGRVTLHPHVLRKFFRSRMATMIPVDVTEALMGHEGYLTECYRRYSEDDLAAFYKKGEHSVTIFGDGADLGRVKAELEEKSKVLNEGMATLALKNADLERRLGKVEADNQELRRQLEARVEALEKLLQEVTDIRAAELGAGAGGPRGRQ